MRNPIIARGVLGVFLALITAASPTFAANGDIDFTTPLCGNTPQSAGADLTYDTAGNRLWVLDQGSGQVCRYTLSAFPPDMLFNVSVNHPFGAASPPFFTPLCTGIAYRTTTQTLFILNATTLQIVEMDEFGVQLGLPINLSPPLPNASLSGLAFDTTNGNFWYRDTVNDIAIECDPNTGATVSQVTLPGEAQMYGSGLYFIEDLGTRYIEFTRGNVLDFRPAKMLRINADTGVPNCVEVDLTQVPDPVLGVVRPPSGTVIYATTKDDVYKIDSTQPAVLPPTDLTCFSNVDGTVSLSWRNCGPGAGGLYTSVRVLRGGVVLQILGGSATSFTDPAPTPSGATLTYEVQGIAGATVAGRSCVVVTGPGGLVNYTPFGGTRPYDLALDPNSGQLYVTDNFSDLIFVYDTDLNLLSVLSTGISNLQGIAYNQVLDILMVSSTGTTLLSPIDPLTGLAAAGQAQLPVAIGSDISAITYDPLNDDYLYVNAAASPVEVVRIDADQMTPGAFIDSCSPPSPSGLLLGRGICHLSQSDTILAPVQQSSSGGNLTAVSELFTNCFPSGFSFPLQSIGGSIDVPNSIRGIEDLANVAYLAGSATNTIYRVLIASGGATFVRGEVNGSGAIDLADVIFVADYLFAGGPTPSCLDAADANDSGTIDISDALYLILYLFQSGPNPPAPFPSAGPDPTFLDPLSC